MLLYNSQTRRKEKFEPLKEKEVSIYVCGITPYDTTHLGHAFTYVSFDCLIRYLRFKHYTVNYTQNVTDIDDDILKRAKQEGKNWIELGEYWVEHFLTDMHSLNVLPPTHYVKATASVPTIIRITEKLQEKSQAYEKNGTVYFDNKTFPEYGKLSHYTIPQMLLLSKERGANPDDPNKKNPLDFILWQRSQPGEPFWESPWGKGRPGWHIECSSMIYEFLGDQIDIHGGGRDLIFPHHESEIAQSESFTGKNPFVRFWMHTAMVQYEGEKMSKSLGNLIMVSKLLKKYSANAIRYLLLSHHYRLPWEYTVDDMDQAQQIINLLESTVKNINPRDKAEDEQLIKQFTEVMEDDLNTPEALDFITHAAQGLKEKTDQVKLQTIRNLLKVMGFHFT